MTKKKVTGIIVDMYVAITDAYSKKTKRHYKSILLRHSYREGKKVKKKTIANLSHCTPEEIEAIKLALKHKSDLSVLGSIKEEIPNIKEGLSIGAVLAVYETAKKLGIEKALGKSNNGKLALWQVIARVIKQGSRLSAVRLANVHAACEVLKINKNFNEEDMYKNLRWLNKNQEKTEKKLYKFRRGEEIPEMFLYDVTSSYLEGLCSELGEFGYNRDGKKGKKQIVIGLLCDEKGAPVSIEIFPGNTKDTETFESQVEKTIDRFGSKNITFVGDRGMIKGPQIELLNSERCNFNYITAITKPQIKKMINDGVIQLGLFDKDLKEVSYEGIRYILRKNPFRAEKIAKSRKERLEKIEGFLNKKNFYLKKHLKAKISCAERELRKKLEKFNLDKWVTLNKYNRKFELKIDQKKLKEISELDGCYVIKSNLPETEGNKELIHNRYKDLTKVESAFRTSKTEHLELRPIFLRKEESMRGYAVVVMLSYLIIRELKNAWRDCGLTVQEALDQLSTLCLMEIKFKTDHSFLRIPVPRKKSQELLNKLNITLPYLIPKRKIKVDTRKKLKKSKLF